MPAGRFTDRLYPKPPLSQAIRPCLFREAAQLKTVAAIVRTAGVEVLRIEPQVQTVDIVRSGRPTEPAVTDIHQYTFVVTAVARGRKALENCPGLSRNR